MRKKLPWFEIALGIVFLSAYVYAAFSDAYNLPNRWFIRDDAYYYYKVAQNIGEGHGSTFDGIHPTNGYHPLWMLVCIPVFALARYDLILPLRVLVLVTGALQLGTAILLYRLIRSTISTPVGVLAALFWSFDTTIQVTLYKTGVESSITLFLIMLLLTLTLRLERTWRVSKVPLRQIVLLAIVAALIVFGRLDLVFFALVMGIWIVLRDSPMRYLLPLDLLSILVSSLMAFVARLGIAGYYDASTAAVTMALLAMLVNVPVFYLLGLYTSPSGWRPVRQLVNIVLASIIGSLGLAAVLLAGAAIELIPGVPRLAMLYEAAFTFGLVLLVRVAAFAFRGRGEPRAALPPLDELRRRARTWLTEGAVYYAIVGGSLALYMLWNKLAFGDFSPVSGQVKRWWGTFWISVYGGPADTVLKFLSIDGSSEFDAWRAVTSALRAGTGQLLFGGVRSANVAWQLSYVAALVVVFVAILALLLLRRRRSVRAVLQAGMIPLFVGSWFQSLSYNATGYASIKEWYWLLQPLLLVILAALLLDLLIELLFKRWLVTRLIMWAAVAWFAYHGASGLWVDTLALYPYGQQGNRPAYPELVTVVLDNTPPGAIIGMTGGGNVGYFLPDRTIVNMDGLINSTAYFAAMRTGAGSDFLYHDGMRYVFANPGILELNPYRGQYTGRLKRLAEWGGKDVMELLPSPSE